MPSSARKRPDAAGKLSVFPSALTLEWTQPRQPREAWLTQQATRSARQINQFADSCEFPLPSRAQIITTNISAQRHLLSRHCSAAPCPVAHCTHHATAGIRLIGVPDLGRSGTEQHGTVACMQPRLVPGFCSASRYGLFHHQHHQNHQTCSLVGCDASSGLSSGPGFPYFHSRVGVRAMANQSHPPPCRNLSRSPCSPSVLLRSRCLSVLPSPASLRQDAGHPGRPGIPDHFPCLGRSSIPGSGPSRRATHHCAASCDAP